MEQKHSPYSFPYSAGNTPASRNSRSTLTNGAQAPRKERPMAKVGNEVKLILRLADEEMERQVETMRRTSFIGEMKLDERWAKGYEDCHSAWQLTLQNIVEDLERK